MAVDASRNHWYIAKHVESRFPSQLGVGQQACRSMEVFNLRSFAESTND